MDSTRGVSPESANQADSTNTAPAPAPDASSVKVQESSDLSTRAAAANSPTAIRNLLKETMEGRVKESTATKPVTEPAKVEPKADPLPPDLEAAANAPAPGTEQTAATPEGDAAPGADGDDAEDSGDSPVTPIKSSRARIRLPSSDEVGRLAISYQNRNRDWSLEQAMEAARKQLGVKQPAAADTPAKTAEPVGDPQLPQTVEEVQTTIATLRAERRKANSELNFEAASELSDKLEDLIEHKAKLERQAERQQNEQASSYDRAFTAAELKSNELYEFTTNPESAGAKRMLEIEADLKALNDPIYYSPDKPLKIAQMAAAELNIAPRRKGVAPVVKPATPPPATKPKSVLPGGESRTTPPTAPEKPAIDTQIGQIRTIGDLRKVQRTVGIQS